MMKFNDVGRDAPVGASISGTFWSDAWIDGFKPLCDALGLSEDSNVVMLRVLGDAGGKRDRNNLAVGAYSATVDQWDRRVKPLWIGELQQEGFECFHRTDMEIPGHGDFNRADWTRERQVPLLNRLHKIIRDHTIHGQGHGVDMTAFERLMPARIKEKFGGAYGICVLQSVIYYGLDAKRRGDWISYIFEAGDEGQSQINKVMADIMNDVGYRDLFRVASFGFGKKKGPCGIVQLQPADFIAFESYKAIENYLLGNPRKTRKSFNELIRPDHDFVMLWTDQSIGAWISRVNEFGGDVIKSMLDVSVTIH